RDHQISKLFWIGETAERAQYQFFFAGCEVSSRNVCVLTRKRLANLRDRDLIGGESFSVNPNIDCSIKTTNNTNFTNPANSFQLNSNCLVGELSQFTERPIR